MTAQQAVERNAVRELMEETGRADLTLGPELWQRSFIVAAAGAPTRQHERYFLVRSQRFEPGASRLVADEGGWFRGFRWWRLDQLASSPSIECGAELQRILLCAAQR